MAKQDNMVQRNREESRAKVEKAIAVMTKLYQNGEQVTVAALMRKTGLSRAFFYNNKEVRAELRRFQGMQEGQSFVYPQKVVLDNVLERTVVIMKKRLADMDAELKRLKAENERLRNAAKASYVSILQEL
jgi:hypothetical protein